MMNPKLCIVIHAEEEFDWNKGFFRSNTQVSHSDELIEVMEAVIELGGKITLAMDYPFVTSTEGKKVIRHFQSDEQNIEFAAHLHPWVNPPFENTNDAVLNHDSFPGNLAREDEYNKLKMLTNEIELQTGAKPISYLAGRYGIGENTNSILRDLGYKVDLSVSAYTDFSQIEGPNFSHRSNKSWIENGITYVPHTCSMLAINRQFENYINTHPTEFALEQKSMLTRALAKLLRVKKYRLSPEGFDFSHMKKVTEKQLQIGQEDFVLSFHSPSVKLGGTPYVKSNDELAKFRTALLDYIGWFNALPNSLTRLAKHFA